MTKTQAGMIKSAFSITYLLFSPLMGWLTDRVGGRKIISFSCLFLGGGTFLMGVSERFTTAAIFYSIVGVGAAAMWVPVVTLIQNWFGLKRRGSALGLLHSSSALGFGLMGLILPVIVLRHHWRAGWYLLGVAGFLLFFVNGLLIRDTPEKMNLSPWGESAEKEIKDVLSLKPIGYLEILREGRFWIIGISYFWISYGAYTIVDFIVTYGVIELQIPYTVASFLITVLAITGIFGGFLLMTLSDYIGRKKSLVIIQISVALTILFIILGGKDFIYLMIGMGCFGFIYGAIWPMYAACARDYFPKGVAGTALGLLTIFYGSGAMISPVLTGYLTDITGTFRWGFGFGAFVSFIAALLIGFLRKREEFE
jgi:MFS family permease